MQTRLTNQLIACLKAYYPAALTWFDHVAQGVTLAMLEAFPSPDGASRRRPRRTLPTCSRPRPTRRRRGKRSSSGQQAQAPQLHAGPPVAQAKARYLLALVAQLRLVMEQVAEYDRAIARVFAVHDERALFASLPGVGTRIAPRLLAEWGEDRLRYPSAASVQALAGTLAGHLSERQLPPVRGCAAPAVKPLRNVLYQFARESIQRDAWAHAYYHRKRGEGKTFTMAVRALSNQWVRILYALWTKREPYDPAVLARAQQAHGRQVA